MRVLLGDKPQESLTAPQEGYIRLSRQEDAIQGAVLSADEATRAYIGNTKWLFIILNGSAFVLGLTVAALADESDRSLLFGGVIVINLLLALFFFFLLRRRTNVWNAKLAARVSGQIFPWPTLGIDQVEFAVFQTRNNETTYLIERLSLSASTGRVVLDPAMMKNGLLIVDNSWRRLRPAAS